MRRRAARRRKPVPIADMGPGLRRDDENGEARSQAKGWRMFSLENFRREGGGHRVGLRRRGVEAAGQTLDAPNLFGEGGLQGECRGRNSNSCYVALIDAGLVNRVLCIFNESLSYRIKLQHCPQEGRRQYVRVHTQPHHVRLENNRFVQTGNPDRFAQLGVGY